MLAGKSSWFWRVVNQPAELPQSDVFLWELYVQTLDHMNGSKLRHSKDAVWQRQASQTAQTHERTERPDVGLAAELAEFDDLRGRPLDRELRA